MEKERFIKKELPTGTGRESESKETLPAVKVDNKVIWVNPAFKEMPFNLKKGEPTRLGIFLTPQPEKEKITNLEVVWGHSRSALLGRAIFKDNQNRLYRDVDLKGAGFSAQEKEDVDKLCVMPVSIREEEEEMTYGIFDFESAKYARNMAERFLKLGIRTERYISLIELHEIIDGNGKKISIEEAEKKKLIRQNQKPVIAVRAFGTKFRIGDINTEEKLKRLEDAKKLVAQELGVDDEKFSLDDYLKWFMKTAGENLGLMHKNRWTHKYLSGHNITLDCRIVDLDSVKKASRKEKRFEMHNDCVRFNDSLGKLITNCIKIYKGEPDLEDVSKRAKEQKELQKLFYNSYIRVLGRDPKFMEII